MRKLLLTLTLVLFAAFNMAFAQERVVTGTVTQKSDGSTLPGVTVAVKGTKIVVATNQNGKFSLKVPSNKAVLVLSFVGMNKEEIVVGTQSVINVQLTEEVTSLNEVIIVAYGTSTKKNFSGSAAQVDSKKLTLAPITNVAKALEGVAPGVQVSASSGQPGAGPSIRIRGFGSVNYSQDPLIVLDGVPFSAGLENINPQDIESVTVLKDAASTALYGNKAANGVVLVTTKKGNKDRNIVQVRIAQGISSRAIPEYDRVGRDEYYPLMWESYKNSLINSSSPVPADIAAQIASGLLAVNSSGLQVYNGKTYSNIKQNLGYNPYNVADNAIVDVNGKLNPNAKFLYPNDLDWGKALERVGSRGDYGISYSGGSGKSDYYISMGYLNEKGFIIKSDYERVNARISMNTQPVKWFKSGLNVSGTISKSNTANDGTSTGYVNPFFFSRTIGPIYPIYNHNTTTGDFIWDANGNQIYDLGNSSVSGQPTRPAGAYAGRHIIAETNYNDNLYKRNMWTGKTYADIIFSDNLKFTTNFSVEMSNYNASTFDNRIVGDGSPAGRASRTNGLATTYNINQLLNYNKTFGKHSFEALAGHESYKYEYNYLYGFRQGIVVDGNTELINFTTTNDLTSTTDKYNKEGYLSRLKYVYDQKYEVTGSFRYDGSSKFSDTKRWGAFWSVSGSWLLTQENFMKGIKSVDNLKIRSSYGTVGSDNGIANYAYQALYSLGSNNAGEPGFLQSYLANNDLVWETNSNFDIGLEFGLFKTVTGSLEYYKRKSTNLLFDLPIPVSSGVTNPSTGASTILKNIGTMANSGLEFQAKTLIFNKENFKWNIDLNLTTVKNELLKLPFTEQIVGTKKLKVGKSMYDYWLREYKGVDPANGNALYRAATWDASTCQVIGKDTLTSNQNNARYHYAGSAIPDLYGAISSNFSYKNFDLSLVFSFQIGGKVYDATYAGLMSSGTYGSALSSDILQRWQKPGDITNVPRLDNGKVTAFGTASDRWLTSASYLNFKTINFGYNVPARLAKKMQMQNVRFYLSGDNLWLKTSRSGLNVTQAFTGVTSNAYTPARVITLGINVTL